MLLIYYAYRKMKLLLKLCLLDFFFGGGDAQIWGLPAAWQGNYTTKSWVPGLKRTIPAHISDLDDAFGGSLVTIMTLSSSSRKRLDICTSCVLSTFH